MNLHYLTRRMLGRPTCVLGLSAQLTSDARVWNIGGPSDRIRVGERSVIKGELLVFPHGGRIEIGDWCFVGQGTRLWSGASITIGNRVMIAHNVNVFDNLTHPLQAEARHAHFRSIVTSGHPTVIELGDKPITIADDAWIGAGATILRGVTIGVGSIVGAASLVSDDVPAYCVVAGNPAKVIKHLERTTGA